MTEAAIELTNALAALGGSRVIPRERLVGLLRDYVALSSRHMDIEEHQVFPRARAVLNAEDWQAIEKGMTIEDDPLFGRIINEQYRSLYDTIVREVAAVDTT
jgi:hemerythrin-like domain-containing protein